MNNIFEDDLDYLEGIVDRVIYTNDENGYSVCELTSIDDELCAVVGIMPFIAAGESIKAYGRWEMHPSFGKQFKVEHYEKQLPATESAILKYLSSGIIKGIGPVTAKRIVEQYMEETFDVLENHPEWLADIPGISTKKALEIGECFKEQFGMRNVMMFCREFFGPAISVRIYKEFGADAVDIITKNPYILCERVHGVGFEKADAIAKKVGIKRNSRDRIAAAVKLVLTYNAMENGHVYIPLEKIPPTADKLLKCGEDLILSVIYERVESGMFVIDEIDKSKCVYTADYYQKERYIAKKLDELEKTNHFFDERNIDALIERSEVENQIRYAPMQRRAISGAVSNSVFLLTGGPGTGKTTVVKAIIQIFEAMGLRISLCAPTGRASKRMSQTADMEAKTIHRMLEMDYSEDGELRFIRNESNPLDSDVVIVDEASMVDMDIMYALLCALKRSARLILIGDANQLPPVGAGFVFRDILESDRYTSVILNHIFRQAEKSYIVVNAHAINNGEYMDMSPRDGDFFFMRRETDEETVNTIISLCQTRLPRKYGENIIEGIQVIAPSHKGEAGTDLLNIRLQSALNPPSKSKKEKQIRHTLFREGDKVMQIKNNYDIPWKKYGVDGTGVFNGDIGTIVKIDNHLETITVDFEGKITEYDFSVSDELEHAYAITVHKSQGSEYPIVIIPLYKYTPKLLTRNLLYTAVTRAQDMIILVGNEDVAKAMIDNDRKTERYTGLRQILEIYEDN